MCYYMFIDNKGKGMNTFSIRLEAELLKLIDDFANKQDRSRNYVIAKILKEKFNYKLTGEC